MTTFDASETEKRTHVWEALSELFVGKELQGCDYRHIAGILRQSGYPMQVLESILREEVAPVFYRNLGASAVPEMKGGSRESIKSAVLEYLNARSKFFWRALTWKWQQERRLNTVKDRWQIVKQLLIAAETNQEVFLKNDKIIFIDSVDTTITDGRYDYAGIDYEEYHKIQLPIRIKKGTIGFFLSYLCSVEFLHVLTFCTSPTELCEIILGKKNIHSISVNSKAIKLVEDINIEVTPLHKCFDTKDLPKDHYVFTDRFLSDE